MSRNTAKWWQFWGDLEEKVCYLMKKEGFHPFKSILWKVSVLWAWETLLFVKNTHFCWPTENCVGLQKMPAYRNVSVYRKMHLPTEESICQRKCVSIQKNPSAYRNLPAYKKKYRPTEMVCKKISELYRLVSTLNTIHGLLPYLPKLLLLWRQIHAAISFWPNWRSTGRGKRIPGVTTFG